MKKHKLLLYDMASKRIRSKLLLLCLLLIVVAAWDLYRPFLGNYWFLLWAAIPVLLILWFYYAFLMRRAALIVTPKYFILQAPLHKAKISYGRITSITSSHMSQHYALKSLKGRDRFRVKPLYEYPSGLIELKSYPKALQESRRWWYSKFLFSPRHTGLLLVVDDWMKLSRDVEEARQKWREARGLRDQKDNRSLAARILDY